MTLLASGLIGYARLGVWLCARRSGRLLLFLVWMAASASCALGLVDLARRVSQVPRPVDPEETQAFWYWASQVDPGDAVLATYEVTAPLSSRKSLYSYILEPNKPKGFPQLGPEFRWVFIRKKDLDPNLFVSQGFDIVHHGDFLTILRR